MKTGIPKTVALAAVAAVALMQACSSLVEAPDPAAIQQQIAAARSEELEVVRATIPDSKRAEQFIELLAERDRLIARYREEIKAHRSRMTALNSDYHARRADFEALLAELNQRRRDSQKELVDLIQAMKQVTTEDEWKTISKFQLKRLHPRTLVYSAAGAGG